MNRRLSFVLIVCLLVNGTARLFAQSISSVSPVLGPTNQIVDVFGSGFTASSYSELEAETRTALEIETEDRLGLLVAFLGTHVEHGNGHRPFNSLGVSTPESDDFDDHFDDADSDSCQFLKLLFPLLRQLGEVRDELCGLGQPLDERFLGRGRPSVQLVLEVVG